jgi:glycosyltransferase involved in cell wall biosynthesis
MKRAAIISPYWDTLGGGEKYLTSVASYFSKSKYQVEIWWHDKRLIEALTSRYGLSLNEIKINPKAYHIFLHGSWLKKILLERNYDLVFILTDGSIPWLFGKYNVLHFQVPFHGVNGRHWLNKLKLLRVNEIICNSRFTQHAVNSEYDIHSNVLYPPIHPFSPLPKEKIILAVGRFDDSLHSKRQDMLLKAFNQAHLKDWKLILTGGLKHPNPAYTKLATAGNDQIQIITNPSYEELAQLYGKAPLFWHAAGYGVDEEKSPEKAEHFGMTTVEAMSAGAVPLAYRAGGQKEVIKHGVNGYFWKTVEELITQTRKLIDDKEMRDVISNNAQEDSKLFSPAAFEARLDKLIR